MTDIAAAPRTPAWPSSARRVAVPVLALLLCAPAGWAIGHAVRADPATSAGAGGGEVRSIAPPAQKVPIGGLHAAGALPELRSPPRPLRATPALRHSAPATQATPRTPAPRTASPRPAPPRPQALPSPVRPQRAPVVPSRRAPHQPAGGAFTTIGET
jgi:hypothetical protein